MEISQIKTRKRPTRRIRATVLTSVALVLLTIALFARMTGAPLRSVSRERIAELVTEALHEASGAAFTGGSEELLTVKKTGEETFIINADTAALGAASARVLKSAQALIAEAGKAGAEVKLGSATGIPAFTGRGPAVRIKFKPMGSVEGRLVSRLRSSGINQSLFSIELSVTARALAVIGGKTEQIEIKTTVPLCETVVVGNVPQVYTNVANEEDMLNLIPTDIP